MLEIIIFYTSQKEFQVKFEINCGKCFEKIFETFKTISSKFQYEEFFVKFCENDKFFYEKLTRKILYLLGWYGRTCTKFLWHFSEKILNIFRKN